jgi:hypothetical protein
VWVVFFLLASALLALRIKTRLTFGERRLSYDDYITVLAWVRYHILSNSNNSGLSGVILCSTDRRITHLSSHQFNATDSLTRSVDIVAKGILYYSVELILVYLDGLLLFQRLLLGDQNSHSILLRKNIL